ncbi:hypothetical protein FBU31_005896, partial [Coemansia sp. 'formosensis']
QHAVILLRDSYMCDVADDYLVSEVFDESPVVYAAMPGLTIPLDTSGMSLNDPLLSPNESIISDRHDPGYRSKRRRYTFSSLRISDSPSFSSQNTPLDRSPQSQCRGAYDMSGQTAQPKAMNNNNASFSHMSSELMPYFKSTAARTRVSERTDKVTKTTLTTSSSDAWTRVESQEHSSPALTGLPMQSSSPNIDCDMDTLPQHRPSPSMDQTTAAVVAPPPAQSMEPTHTEVAQTASADTTVTSTPVVPVATIVAATAPVTKDEEAPATKEDSPNVYLRNTYPALIKRLSDPPTKSADVTKKSPQPSPPAASNDMCVVEPTPPQTNTPLVIQPSLKSVVEPPAEKAESVISISSHGTVGASDVDSDSSEEESGSSEEESGSSEEEFDEESESSSSSDEEGDTKDGSTESADMEVDETTAPKSAEIIASETPLLSTLSKVTLNEGDENKAATAIPLAKSASVAVVPEVKVPTVAPTIHTAIATAVAELPDKKVATTLDASKAPSIKDASDFSSESDSGSEESESEEESESDSSEEESDSAALNTIRALSGKAVETKSNGVAKPPVSKVEVS